MGLRPQCPSHQKGGLTMKIETYEATRGMHKFLEPTDLLLSFARAFYDSLTLFRDGWNASCGSVFAVSPQSVSQNTSLIGVSRVVEST